MESDCKTLTMNISVKQHEDSFLSICVVDVRLLTSQSLQSTQTPLQEVRVPRPYYTSPPAEDTVSSPRIPDIYHQPSLTRLLLQTNPTRCTSQADLNDLHCSHLDAMRSTPLDFLESRAYSTLVPCYSRDYQSSCHSSLAADADRTDKVKRGVAVSSRESVVRALEGPASAVAGGRYFSLNRLRQDPLYAHHPLSISSQSSAGPSAVDGCLASGQFNGCQSNSSVLGSGFDSGHESRRRRYLDYAVAASDDKLRPYSPKLAGIYRTATKMQPSPDGNDQDFDCY